MKFFCKACRTERDATYLRKTYWLRDDRYYYGCEWCGEEHPMSPCNICGHWISNRAHTCPKCGDPKWGSVRT